MKQKKLYMQDVFGRASYEGFFDFRDLSKMTMDDSEVCEFIKGAERREVVDKSTGWKAIVYVKNGTALIYDTIKPDK